MSDVEGLAEVIGGGLRKCRVEDGVPVRLIREGDVYHVTHMVTEAILASPWLAASVSAARADALEDMLSRIKTHNDGPITPKALRWAATHEALCRSWIFDVLMGLADEADRAAALRAEDAGGEGL